MDTLRDGFWVFALGVIGAYAFFAALGAFAPGDVVGVTIAVGALVALWCWHAWRSGHAPVRTGPRDDRLSHARERRGF